MALKTYPAPILKTLWPFFVGGGIVTYLISKGADASMNSDEFKNDPRNPRFVKHGVKKEEH